MKGIPLRFILCAFFFLLAAMLSAQATSLSAPSSPFLIPQTIFVGDSGRLVIPLHRSFSDLSSFVLAIPDALPETPELVIQRVELEKRMGSPRLLVDFIPYVPGLIKLPSLDFLFSGTGQEGLELQALKGLEVQVASILTPSQMTLSEPASPLAVPGTSFLVYGTLILVLLLLFLGIAGSFFGRHHFKEIWERFRRRHLLRVMKKFLRQLKLEDFNEKKENPAYYLSLLSGELKEFLSFFTGVDCRPLTAGEFMGVSLGYGDDEGGFSETLPESLPESEAGVASDDGQFIKPDFLCALFRNWDTVRFSGRAVEREDLLLALKETEDFIFALDRAERKKPFITPNDGAAPEPAAEAHMSRGSPAEGAAP